MPQHAPRAAHSAGDSAPAGGGAAQDRHHQPGGRIGSPAEALGRLRRLHADIDAGALDALEGCREIERLQAELKGHDRFA